MEFLTTYFSPSLQQLMGLAGVLIVGLALSVIGAAVGGRARFAPADLLAGWGVVALIFTLIGTLTSLPFTYITLALAFIAAGSGVYVWRRDGRLLPDGAGKILLMNGLLFILISAMQPSQWDEYSHWLLAARYLFEVDLFPGIGLPVPLADYPAYPTGASLIPYLVSKTANHFVENAAPLFHILLLVSLGLAALDVIRQGAGLDRKARPGWGLCALGFMTVTIFSTAFVQKIIFTAYADLPVAAATAMCGLLGWMILQALSENDQAKARTLALQMGLVLTILLDLKPATIVLMVGVLGGVLIAALRDPDIRMSRFLKLLPLMTVSGIVILIAWSWYTSIHLPHGSHSILPFDEWQWHQMPHTLATIASIMTKKGAYFGMMLVLSVLAFIALFRYRTRFDRFVLIAGSTFVGYNLFLVFVYLAIHKGYTGLHALSYWRYNLHIAHLGVFCAAYGLSVLWQAKRTEGMERVLPYLAKAAIVIVVVLPVVFAPKLRFDLRLPKQFVKEVGRELTTMLPASARVYVFDPLSAGFYAKLMRYQLYGAATQIGDINVFMKITPQSVRKGLETSKPTHVWVHTQNDIIVAALGVDLPKRNAHLLEKQRDGWQLVKSWPYPGYNQPQDIPD